MHRTFAGHLLSSTISNGVRMTLPSSLLSPISLATTATALVAGAVELANGVAQAGSSRNPATISRIASFFTSNLLGNIPRES